VDAGLELHLAGVRWGDIELVVNEVLHLEPNSWNVASLSQVEWYATLSPPSAQRLARALGGTWQRGKGALSRKEFLARGIPVDIKRPQPEGRGRPRAALHGDLNVYRIINGATAVWKAELVARVPSKGTPMALSERERVRNALLQLLVSHQVEPIGKPSRWEPEDPDDDVWHDAPGPRLRAAQYRGPKPEFGWARFSGVISQLRITGNHDGEPIPATSTGTPGVSDHILSTALDEGMEQVNHSDSDDEVYEELDAQVEALQLVPTTLSAIHSVDWEALFPQAPTRSRDDARTEWVSTLSQKTPAWLKPILTDLLDGVNGFISEVSIPSDINAAVVVEGLVHTFGERIVIRFLGLDGDVVGPLAEAMLLHRPGPSPDITVLVIDPMVPEELLLSALQRLREAVEAIEGRVILITHAGFLGSRRNAYEPRELRSTVYGARYWAHQRYRVAPNRQSGILEVEVTKDERHGRPGRRIYTAFGPDLPRDLLPEAD
jgi:hypothetical protein